MATLAARVTALAQAIAADIKVVLAGLAGKAASGANTDITSITGSAAKLTTARTLATTGDATGSATFDGSANVSIGLTLAASGVTAGTYVVTTVDAKGRVTAGRALQAGDIPQHSAALLTSGTLDAARLPVSGITAGEYAVATFDAYGRATSGRALQVSDLPPSNVAGTWGVVGVDGYGRVTAGRQATAADIVTGILAIARLPVVGQVTQSGSSIIEMGQNVNGYWARLAGGWQVCWRVITTDSMAINPNGGLSPVQTWNFPAAFVDSNWVGFLQNMSGWGYDYSLGFEGKATNYMGGIYIKNTSAAAHQQVHNIQAIAVGRFY